MNHRQHHPLDAKSRQPKVRSATIRKLAKDGTSWTPTEALKRDKLMRQFMRTGRKGAQVTAGNSPEYREGYDKIDWSRDCAKCGALGTGKLRRPGPESTAWVALCDRCEAIR